jgi:hypothetical protein
MTGFFYALPVSISIKRAFFGTISESPYRNIFNMIKQNHFMGNRQILHDTGTTGHFRREWQHKH